MPPLILVSPYHKALAAVIPSGGDITFIAASDADYMNASLVLTKPSEVQVGDLMVIVLTSTTASFTAPAGWDLQKDFTWPSYSYTSRIYTRIATVGEPTSYLFQQNQTITESMGALLVYRNASGVSVMKQFRENKEIYSFDSLTTLLDKSLVVTYACDRSPTIPTIPAGQTSRVAKIGTFLGMRIADRLYANAGSVVSPTSTGGTVYNGAYVIFALR